MIDKNAINEILATYKKYGWMLRRVLLTDPLRSAIGAEPKLFFGGVPIVASDIDAAWFSRPPQPGLTAWEIRHLSADPYALLESVDENSAGFEQQLRSVEARLRTAVRRSS
jgi:hypothetical protein